MAKHFVICCESYFPSVGGVQEVLRQIAERLVVLGYRVTVLTSKHRDRSDDEVLRGVRVISLDVRGNLVRGLFGEIEKYKSLLLNLPYDAVLVKAAQQWTFDCALEVWPLIRARKIFIPCGFSGLRNPSYSTYYAHMADWLGAFDVLMFYSTDYQDIEFAKKYGHRNVCVVPNGVDEREFEDLYCLGIRRQLGVGEDEMLLLSVGTLIRSKGHWEVIRRFLAAELTKDTTLVINGAPPPNSGPISLLRAIKYSTEGRFPLRMYSLWTWLTRKAKGVRKRIKVVNLDRPSLVSLFKTANLFVFASHVEYSPLVIVEAMASGTPFLSTDVGNCKEIALATKAGRVIEGSNAMQSVTLQAELSRQIEHMLGDCSMLRAMSRAGRAAVFQEGLTWAKIVKLYQRILDPDSESEERGSPRNVKDNLQ